MEHRRECGRMSMTARRANAAHRLRPHGRWASDAGFAVTARGAGAIPPQTPWNADCAPPARQSYYREPRSNLESFLRDLPAKQSVAMLHLESRRGRPDKRAFRSSHPKEYAVPTTAIAPARAARPQPQVRQQFDLD